MCIERPSSCHALRERFSGNVCHRKEHEPANLVHGENWHDARVGQPGHGPRLAQEPPAARVVTGEAGEQDLDRDAPVQPSLTREVYVRHPAAPNRRLDVVGVGERRAQIGQIQLRRLSHGALHYPARPRKFAALLLDTDAVSGADSAPMTAPSTAHQPYVPPTESPAELTPRAIALGVLLGLIFGASNVYLALKIGRA